MRSISYTVLGLVFLCGVFSIPLYDEPEQIHIASSSSDSMIIVWNTLTDTQDSRVLYGTQMPPTHQTVGVRTKFTDGGSEKRVQYVHEVKLTGLKPATMYYYVVGSKDYAYSSVFYFTTWPEGDNWSPSLAVYGDLGNANAKSLIRLQNETIYGKYDAVLHVGDFAYNMFTDNARVGDAFMRQIEPIAATLPYMTCPGNHESSYNFSNYKNRFRMPGDTDMRMYYSFKMGPVRFISTSTELIFNPQNGLIPIVRHYAWLENELKDPNLPANRAGQPWVIVFGHRPMYCSNSDNDDCTHNESMIRCGIPPTGVFGWEKLFYQYGVDIGIWAHEHSYERMLPVYNRKVMNGSVDAPYTNPRAPVHITTGSARCSEGHDPFKKHSDVWSAFHSQDYGYTRMKVFNSSLVYMEQVSDDKGGEVIDKVWVIKDKHGPYEFDPKPVKPVGDMEEYVEKYQDLVQLIKQQLYKLHDF